MNLKDFLAQRENPPEAYWSIIIETASTQSGIWHIDGETAVIESIGVQSAYSNQDELITSVDASLSSAMQNLADDSVEPKNTVFGVPFNWVTGGEIKDVHLGDFKKICDELSLTPVGFVVLPEAIAHLYKSDEGAPLSAVIVGLSENSLDISVFKLGKLIGNASVARSVSLADDVIEGLTRFESAAPLPSRIIIYDGKESELESAKDELQKTSWDSSEKIKFLHTPKAEILSPDRKVFAVSLAGASEIGEVSKVTLREFTPIGPEIENIEPVNKEVEARDLGFVVDEDVTHKIETVIPESPKLKSFRLPPLPVMPKLPKLPKFNLKVAPVFTILLIVVAIFGIMFYFLPKVVVTVFVAPKDYEGTIDINFDSNNSKILTSTVDGEKTKNATGRKVVGEKAKGSVEIANGNGSSIKLSAGTILTSSSGLKFTTLQEASISGQLLPGSPGTAVVNVVGNDIGSQYNLGKDEIFTVGNYAKSLVAGTSKSDFTGGSSRDISAISKEDRDILSKELQDELIESAKKDLLQKIDSTHVLISDPSTVNIIAENFDHKVGDEADNLKLTMEILVKGVSVDKNKLFEFTSGKLKDVAPSGYILRSDQIDYTFELISEKNDEYVYKSNVKVNFLPSINDAEVVNNISGKSIDLAKTYLNTLSGFKGAQISFNNKVFSSFKRLPFLKDNITIEIAAEE